MNSVALAKLRAELAKNGWSQYDLAEACGVTQAHISFVLNGHRTSKRLLVQIRELSAKPRVEKEAAGA